MLRTGLKVDVVLTDLALPEMSGVELMRIIRINTLLCQLSSLPGAALPRFFLSLTMIRYFRSPSPSCSRRSLRR
ncbi:MULTISPECIES: hypothetical protein [Bradyrhizobium]|uniref:hypothetical protein n=1 Tax=Bradyrhizobium arachidis TaxID=858423 RepID=UPI0009FDAC09